MATAREPIIKAGYIAATSGIQQISIATGSRSIQIGDKRSPVVSA